MGGKTAMMAALRDPDTVERLVVVDIAPVPTAPHHLALVQAMRALDLAGLERRSQADRLLAPAVPDIGRARLSVAEPGVRRRPGPLAPQSGGDRAGDA